MRQAHRHGEERCSQSFVFAQPLVLGILATIHSERVRPEDERRYGVPARTLEQGVLAQVRLDGQVGWVL